MLVRVHALRTRFRSFCGVTMEMLPSVVLSSPLNGKGSCAVPSVPRVNDVGAAFKVPAFAISPPPSAGNFDMTVLGSGVSTAVPALNHVLRRKCGNPTTAVRHSDGLTVCEEAFSNPESKNRRFNVSLLLRFAPLGGGRVMKIMVDAGKTMRQAALASFPQLGVDSIDALLLTHGHADAILGMDDLRDLQEIEKVLEDGQLIGYQPAEGSGPIRVVSNKDTLQRVREVFPYLCSPVEFVRDGVMLRRTVWLEFEELQEDNTSISIAGLPVRVFPVWHGGTYVSLGFAFGTKVGGGHPVVYISDVKDVPPETMAWLEQVSNAGLDLLIVDALSRESHTTHFSLSDALAFVRKLRPHRALLVGMQSCSIGDHDEVNAELAGLQASEGLDVQLAYDGMQIPEFASGIVESS
eukprot:TRINITY_DN48921_c0_g1_i1.p1 TRINITY_DN48921_c0_g1~~TRINITY_DN48921_c0_g1_i1.p1  ORF type:complete len:408 (-),score=59.08 TRINITY_DN48921_c0_g1_i1:58-1281(-)